jgi:hypothetical protein
VVEIFERAPVAQCDALDQILGHHSLGSRLHAPVVLLSARIQFRVAVARSVMK